MKAEFKIVNEQISDLEIQEFEQSFNVSLPENYKKLLKKFNGSFNENDEMALDYFCGVKYGKLTLEDSINVLQIWEKNISREYLPFGGTATGNILAIYLNHGENYGKIYLFRSDLECMFFEESLEDLLGITSIDEL